MSVKFYFLTIIPEVFQTYTSLSIWKRAQDNKIINVIVKNIRDFTEDKHKTVDDKPFSGGPGMLLMAEPILKALAWVKQQEQYVISFLLEAAAPVVTQEFVEELVNQRIRNLDNSENKLRNVALVFIAPRYEGVDARVREVVDYVVSIGPYILTGGELPALVLADAIVRLIPGVLGNQESPQNESMFIVDKGELFIKPEAPQYTRPRKLKLNNKVLEVPQVLVSGDHKRIRIWKEGFSKRQRVRFLTVSDV